MARSVIEMLCCPSCKGELVYETVINPDELNNNPLICNKCNVSYRHSGAWYNFLDGTGLLFKNRREKFFRSVLAKAYTPLTNMMFLLCGGPKSARNEVMSRLRVKVGDAVLETGIGYGENFLWLASRTEGLHLYGLDIQEEMMTHCASNLHRWKITAGLARADAQKLPYRDSVFDVVFHLGAINLFEDKGLAIREMIRVAKSGTHIVIADETEKAGRLFNIFTGSAERVVPPVDLVPTEMKNITLSTIWKGYGYVIEFNVAK